MSANGGIVPFFTAPSSGETPSRRLLLVSHSFPPDASIGALRWQKLASAAFARDWGIDVIMMDPAESALREDSRLRELPAGTHLYGVATREPLLERWHRSAIRVRNRMRDTRALSTASGRSAVRSVSSQVERGTGSIRSELTALKRTYLARMFFNRWSDCVDRSAKLGVSLARVRSYRVVESLPMRPRSEALAMLRAAAMVVVLLQQYVHSIPGKVFEYVQLQAWLLALSLPGTATELLLRDSGADVVHPDDVVGMTRAIVRRYRDMRAGARPVPINADGRFDRARQAALLLDALDRLA